MPINPFGNLFAKKPAGVQVSATTVEYRDDALSDGSEDRKKGASVQSITLLDEESLDSGSLSSDHIFKDPKQAEYYRNLYEDAQYECRHLFDPEFTWTEAEEKKVVRKNDWYITFWAFIMFTALDFDRYNISQALSANMLDHLELTTNDYNLGTTINLVCFLLAELPSQLISKKIGADVWIPMQLCLWSVVSMSQAAMTNRAGFLITRGLLGACQGGFICDVCLWMSYFFKGNEMPFRLSLFYIANPLTTVWSSLLSFPILKIKSNTGLLHEPFRWLFLIEGAFTFLVGVISFFKMPASAAQTKTWYRKKGWYTDREEKICVNRVLRDDPSKGDMNNREPVSPKDLVKSLLDYDLLPIYIVRLLAEIGTSPVKNYMTLTLRKLGFSTFKTNALTIPPSLLSIVTLLLIGYISQVLHESSFVIMSSSIWIIACLFPLRYWSGSQVNVWGTYALLTVLLAHAPICALTVSWCSFNSNSVQARAVSAALVNIFAQTAGIISANIYRMDDKPLYHRGNVALIGCAFGAVGACIFAKIYYRLRNKSRDAKWNKMSPEEQERYQIETTDKGNKRLDFRFVS